MLEVTTSKSFSELKIKLISHLTGNAVSGTHHLQALKLAQEQTEHTNRCMQVQQKLLHICLEVIKQKAAAQYYERQVGMMSYMGVDVGTIEHSRSVYVVLVRGLFL